MTDKHSPTPWNLKKYDTTYRYIYDNSGQRLFKIDDDDHDNTEANAKHIVNCVNNHDALVEALERIYLIAETCINKNEDKMRSDEYRQFNRIIDVLNQVKGK